MRLNVALAALMPILTLFSSCGGGGNGGGGGGNGVPQNAQVTGPWQAKAVSSKFTNAPTVFVETNLTQASASLQSSAFLVVNSCVNSNASSSVSGTVNGQAISLTATYAGVTVVLDGSVSTDGSTMSGSYIASGACVDSDQGVWTAQKMGTVAGNYTGTVSSNANPSVQISVNASLANSSFSISGSAAISSVCFNNLILTGFQIGGAAAVTGTNSFGSNVLFVFVTNDTAFNSLTGVYQVKSGSCAGDAGTGTLTRVGSAAVNAPPIDGLDRVVESFRDNRR